MHTLKVALQRCDMYTLQVELTQGYTRKLQVALAQCDMHTLKVAWAQ